MDSFDRFVSDLVAHESDNAPAPALGGIPAITNETRILLQLRDDILRTGLLIAVTSGIANALESGQPKISPYLLEVYAPSDSPFVRTLVDALLITAVPLDVSRSIQSFTARLTLAQRMGSAFGSLAPAQTGAPSTVDVEVLADAWRRAAAAAVEAVGALNAALRGVDPSNALVPSAMKATLNLLYEAKLGEPVCIDPQGRISIPGWAERRSEKRTTLGLEAAAIVGKLLYRVTIRDASTTGLGLAGAIEGEPGAKALIKLPGNRQLSGRIAWNDGRRSGIELDERLDVTDPLLQAH